MKNKLLLVLLTFVLCGCQTQEKSVTVTIAGEGKFPEKMAGRWVAESEFWQLLFDDDGSILKAHIALGGIEVFPGKTTEIEIHSGGQASYEPGLWMVDYDPETRILRVEINILQFYHEIQTDVLMGDSRDILIGKVSEDYKSWEVDWYNGGLLLAIILGEPKEMESIEEPEFRKSLVFNKVLE